MSIEKRSTSKAFAITFGLILAFLASGVAKAQDAEFARQGYAGISLGSYERTNNACSLLVETLDLVSSCSESNNGIRLFGGYTINPYLSVEVGYITVSEIVDLRVALSATARFPAASGGVSGDFTSLDAGVRGQYPVSSKLSIVGIAGIDIWEVSFTDFIVTVDSRPPRTIRFSTESVDDTDLFLGFGLQFDASEKIVLSLDARDSDANVSAITFSVAYTFSNSD